MSKVRGGSFSISIDGFGAGAHQSLDHPLGVGGRALHEWAFATRTFRRMSGDGIHEGDPCRSSSIVSQHRLFASAESRAPARCRERSMGELHKDIGSVCHPPIGYLPKSPQGSWSRSRFRSLIFMELGDGDSAVLTTGESGSSLTRDADSTSACLTVRSNVSKSPPLK